tara:strand:- start:457 stop:783 length:327 start_codon:yes stop_codon:yes gene_type:complete
MVAETVIAMMITATATTAAPNACKPGRPLTACEAQIFDDAVLWKRRAHVTRARLEGCEEKNAIRTASVAQILAPCPPCKSEAPQIGAMITTGAGALALGLLLGIFAVQ